MNEIETNIRQSLLDTLSFLASEAAQREFAEKVRYDCYQGEFACWWFDTFFPEEPIALQMFRPNQLAILKAFSETFDQSLNVLGMKPLSIEQLHAKKEWKTVVAKAGEACSELEKAT